MEPELVKKSEPEPGGTVINYDSGTGTAGTGNITLQKSEPEPYKIVTVTTLMGNCIRTQTCKERLHNVFSPRPGSER